MKAIRFGTEGFRGVIAREFTFATLHRLAAAYGRLDLPLKAPLDFTPFLWNKFRLWYGVFVRITAC